MAGKCSCGSNCFEDVDVTPVGINEKRYFTRCTKCGLVVFTQGCSLRNKKQAGFSKLLNALSQMPARIFRDLPVGSSWHGMEDTKVRG